MNQKPELSDAEIRSYMDFDSILRKRAAKKSATRAWLFGGTVAVVMVAIMVSLLLTPPTPQTPSGKPNIPAQEVVPEQALPTPSKKQEPVQPITGTKETKASIRTTQEPVTTKEQEAVTIKEEEPHQPAATPGASAYVQAEPTCGYPALYEYFNKSLVYPQEAVKDSIQGVLTVSFIINIGGKPEQIEIKETLGVPFEREAKRLIENMPLWKPALLNNRKVPSKISLPLTFQVK